MASDKKPRVFGTKEWASLNANCVKGCSHNCKYCYAKAMAIRFKRSTPERWAAEEPDMRRIAAVAKHAPSRVMFPTSHDISPGTLEECATAIRTLLDHGHTVLVVSKPHLHCVKRLCKEFAGQRDRILFRFTIGSTSNAVLTFWEPGAPSFKERLAALKHAHKQGFATSVSCEPMLDANVDAVVAAVENFVTDAVWIGRANQLLGRLRVNGVLDEQTRTKAMELLQTQTNERILDLYKRLKDNPRVKWKESIKAIVGLPVATEAGLDV